MAVKYYSSALLVLIALSGIAKSQLSDAESTVLSVDNEMTLGELVTEDINDVLSNEERDSPDGSKDTTVMSAENGIKTSSTSSTDKASYGSTIPDTTTSDETVSSSSVDEFSTSSDESSTKMMTDDQSTTPSSTTNVLLRKIINNVQTIIGTDTEPSIKNLITTALLMTETAKVTSEPQLKDASTVPPIKGEATVPPIKYPSTLLPIKGETSVPPMKDANTVSAERSATTVEDTSTAAPKQTYQEAEKEITDYINSLLRSLLPQIIGGSGDAKLSQKCTAAMMKVFSYIRRMKGWTVKMLDSMGKPASGILYGTSYSMGNYEQCLDLSITNKGAEATDPKDEMFHGQYCRVRITLPEVIIEHARKFQKGLLNATDLGKLKEIIQVIPYIPVKSNYMTHFVGLCFPSTCTSDDLNQLVQLIPFPSSATVDRCEVKTESKVDFTQLVVICVFLVLCVLVVASTFFDWLRHPKREEKSDERRDKRCVSVTVSFSVCNNTSRLMKNLEDEGDSALAGQSVRGIFVMAVAWIVLGHTYLFPYEGYYFQMSSLANLRDYWDAGYFSLVMAFPLAIDALFVCYGFLFTYSLWYAAVRPDEVKVNVISLIVRNYIRLCIPLLLCFGIIFILPLSGSGPFWGDLMEGNIDRCRQNAPAYFGMYGNFLEWEEQCFPHLWFVSCLAQLTLVGIFLSWILSRNVKVGAWITILIIIACNGTVGVISYWNDFPPSYLAYFTEQSSSYFWQISMAFPLSHFGSYAVGMLSGIFIAKKDTRRNRGCLGVIGWIACAGLLYAIFLVLYNSRNGIEDAMWNAVLASVHRTAFALCVSWVMVACAYGLGGFINAILSWKVFDPLFRLSYYAYIFHFIVISYIVSISTEHTSFTHLELVLRAFSYLGATYFISYILYLLLELPLVSLKEAFCPKKAFRIEVTPLQTYSTHKGDFISKNTIEGSVKLWSITESPNGMSF